MSEENPKFEQQKEQLIRTLATMFDYLGLNGTFRVEMRDDRISVKIASDDAGRVIGRKGQTLESLQLLANRIMFKTDNEFPHVMLDIDGYARGERESRDGDDDAEPRRPARGDSGRRQSRRSEDGPRTSREQLEQQARDAAKEVKRWGEPVKLPEMNAHDRRIIHLALQDDPEITTESEGEGNFKKVVVSLKKAE
ncbi:MAG: KH domain-containing protein [Lentisphaeria bacterium]|nr:KH domain-containing protein [Lentisphaeria bacterium]